MNLSMSKAEREEFLAGVHVGILSVAADGRGPLVIPIWYAYEPGGEIRIETERSSRKMQLLERAGRFSLCAQTESPPYRYVSVEGPVSAIEPAGFERDTRFIAYRYLGQAMGDRYLREIGATSDPVGTVIVRMRPERWASADFAKQFGSGAPQAGD